MNNALRWSKNYPIRFPRRRYSVHAQFVPKSFFPMTQIRSGRGCRNKRVRYDLIGKHPKRRFSMSRTRPYDFSPRSRLKFLSSLIQLVVTCLVLTVPQQGFAQKMVSLASDPVVGAGFARALWVNSINRFVVFVGNPKINNEVRAFDPVTNTWTFLYTNDPPVGSPGHPGIPGRDNYASWYVSARDEMWLWGGSYVDGLPPNQQYYTGRFSFAGCHPVPTTNCGQWVWRSLNHADVGPGIVKNNIIGYGADPGCAWSGSGNRGMCGWAFNGENAQIPFVVEPNDANSVCPGAGTGSEPYISCYVRNGMLPPPRVQCMNCLVAVGNDFYLYGGEYNNGPRIDLWKFSGATHTWMRLSDSPPRVSATPVLTYDSDLNALVVWADNKIYVFDLATQQWSNRTPQDLPCIGNHLGVYASNVKTHIYEGGTYCAGPRREHATGITIGISFSGAGTPISTSLSGMGDSASPPSPTPTPSTSSGRTPVGYLDGIDANGIASGWTYDPDASSQNNTVQIYADGPAGSGTLIGALTATAPRLDVNSALGISGDHGFTFSIPANLKDGKQHQLYAYGIDLTGDANFLLNGSPKSFIFGSISSTPAPTPAPTLTSAPTPTSTVNATTGDATCYGGLCLPQKTWIARGLPAQGNGPCSLNGECKQYSATLNSDNGRIYFYGGDTVSMFGKSTGGWQAVFSYAVLTDQWAIEAPNCVVTPKIQPNYTTEESWVYDSTRNLFYWLGGGTFPSLLGKCPNDSIIHHGPAMTFNPVTGLWSDSPFAATVNGGIGVSHAPQAGVYDPVGDKVYQPTLYTGGLGMAILDVASNTWSVVGTPCADNNIGGAQGPCGPGQTYINSGFTQIDNLWIDIDVVGRYVYFINVDTPHLLLRYNISTQSVSAIALPIARQGTDYGENIAFDSVNRLVYWWTNGRESNSVLYIYHPDPTGGANGTWELDPMFQPDGLDPRGETTVYDKTHNVFMVIGGVNFNSEVNPSFSNYLFLYRYGNGDGKPYTPPQAQPSSQLTPKPSTSTPPPSAPPSTLTAKYLGVTGEDKVGAMNQTTPNGKLDFHISVSGLRGTPTTVTITNENIGKWEVPFNGTNWIIATQYDGTGNGDFWLEQYASNKFHVKVRYTDGTTDEADASNQVSTPPPEAPSPPPGPLVTLSPTNLTFAKQVIGSAAASQQVSLSNAGGAPLTIDEISVTGDFSQLSTCSSPLAPGATCMITVSFQPLVPGTRTGILSIVDNAAGNPHITNLTGSAAAPLTADTTPPSVYILSPAGGTVSKTVRGKIKAADNVAISKIELYKDGALVGTAASDSYSFHWDTTNDQNGTHTLIAMAYDTSNNRSSAVVSIDVQNAAVSAPPIIAPSIVIQSPASGTIINTASVTLSAQVSSPTPIRNIQFKLDGVNLGPKIKSAPYTLTWDTTNVSNGIHVITATVHDVAGNTGTSSGTTVQLNRPAVKRPVLGRRF
jgi:Bacterial Ig domain/Galactose oxidase, central domain